MDIVVKKFGGTSVGTIERIKAVAQRIADFKQTQSEALVVVVSAMAGETDRLIKLCWDVCDGNEPYGREYDMMISTGEQVSAALLAMCLVNIGVDAISYNGYQFGLTTDVVHKDARIKSIKTEKIQAKLQLGKVVIVTGFQGVTKEGDITTLGRGGSDTSAVALAAALKAKKCYIYTDVDGIYTTDPNVCPRAQKIPQISYDEMLELASLGAKVLQIRSVEMAKRFNVPVVVLSSFNNNPGTEVINGAVMMENTVVTGVSYDKNQARIGVWGIVPELSAAEKIFTALAKANICIDTIVQSTTQAGKRQINYTLSKADRPKALAIISKLSEELGYPEVDYDDNVAKVSIVGLAMRTHTGIAAKMFKILADAHIHTYLISTSEIKISCIIPLNYMELAVRSLHTGFGLDKEQAVDETNFNSNNAQAV